MKKWSLKNLVLVLLLLTVKSAYSVGLPYSNSEGIVTGDPAINSTVPNSGPSGANGSTGSYSCQQMTWGEACVDLYSFGDYNVKNPSNGQNAPSGNAVNVTLSGSSVSGTVSGSPAPAAGTYTVNVTQLSSAQIYTTSGAALIPNANTVLNNGRAFDLTITPFGQSPVIINFGANTTLSQVEAAIDSLANFTATQVNTLQSGTNLALKVSGRLEVEMILQSRLKRLLTILVVNHYATTVMYAMELLQFQIYLVSLSLILHYHRPLHIQTLMGNLKRKLRWG